MQDGEIHAAAARASARIGSWHRKPSDGWAKRIRGRKHQPIRAIFYARFGIGVIAARNLDDLREKAQDAFDRKDRGGLIAALVVPPL